MRLVTFRCQGGTRSGRVDGDTVTELRHPDVGAVLADGQSGLNEARDAVGERHSYADLDLAPLIPRPGKFICVGLNYGSHIREMGREPDEYPTLFATYAEAIIGARDPIVIPSVTEQLDWEAELAVVIGSPVRNAEPKTALAAIAGYTVYNDVSARDWQWRTSQWLQGKTFEGTSPLGPELVTLDEVGGHPRLAIQCEVDGVIMQDANTEDLAFGPAALVQYVSRILTLQPADIIATGTPAGVGAGLDPPRFLQRGQIVRTTIEGLGEQVNTCVRESI